VLTNTASASDTLRNAVDIYAPFDSDDWNNQSEAEIHVGEGQPDVYVWKDQSSNDPAPGQTLLYKIGYGNDGPIASGPVVLTDTLPDGVEVVSWHSRNGYHLWNESDGSEDQLVLTVPTVPGQWGDEIYLRVRLSDTLPLGTKLTNTVEITTAVDADPENNADEEDDAEVSEPRWDIGVRKNFGWGSLVPGGEAGYHIYARNHGNMAVDVSITDTLPAGTSFDESWQWTGWTSVPSPPEETGDDYAVWELAPMEPGEELHLNVRLNIGDVSPGTTITNCAAIGHQGDDDWPYNDSECVADTVRERGPNLRIWKESDWEDDDTIEYKLHVENIGSQRLEDVWITDTYPVSTSVEGWWDDFHRWVTGTIDASHHQAVFWIQEMDPGNTGRIELNLALDGDVVGQQGLSFVNTAEAPVAGDVYPADNQHSVVAGSGPDLFVTKWIHKGEPEPGERITFTVRAGNQNEWPWPMSNGTNARVTERLPEGMTYIDSFWTDGTHFEPLHSDLEAGLVIWDMRHYWSEEYDLFHVVVDLDEDIDPLQPLINQVEIKQTPQLDIDPFPANNVFTYAVIQPARLFLPAILK